MEFEGCMSSYAYEEDAGNMITPKKRRSEDYHDAEVNMETDKAPAAEELEEEEKDDGNMITPNNGRISMLPTNESLRNSPASSSVDSSNSNNHESSRSPSRPVSSFVDPSLSVFEKFYSLVFEKFIDGGIPLITVRVDNAVFGTDMELHLVLDDVQNICCMKDLSVNCVMAYIRHIYDVLVKRRITCKFGFINPASVSYAKDGADFSRIVTSRWEKLTCEWVLMPVNPEGAGWLLAVIHMPTMTCYWLDPSGSQDQSRIRHFVTLGLVSLQRDAAAWKKSPVWHIVKCPTRKSKVECGFYVLKFMREIIAVPSAAPSIFTRSEPFY